MDPISIIVAALVAGATTGATNVSTDAISDAYKGLKGLIRRAFGDKGDTEAERLVDEDNPKANETALRSKLAEQQVDRDEEILRAAKNVLAKADPEGYKSGRYNVTVSGGQGVQVGNQNTQTNTFGSPPPA